MNILTARHYVSPRTRPLTPEERETRRLAYAIKTIAANMGDFDTAARDMARLIEGPCWLIPIPDRNGNLDANTRLAALIAHHVGNSAQVVRAIRRTSPIESQCERHRKRQGPIAPRDHHFVRSTKWLGLRPTYFVDNVTTSGNTFRAAHAALAFGTGLAFADANSPLNH
jgi:hypothetical protein